MADTEAVIEKHSDQCLQQARREAERYLAIPTHQRADSDWFKSFLCHPETLKFFKEAKLASAPLLQIPVVTLVARAYAVSLDEDYSGLAPTGSEVRALRAEAAYFENRLVESDSWLVVDGRAESFRGTLRRIALNPSRLEPRTSGRRPLLKRRAFVLALAESLCELTGQMNIGFLAVATARGWDGVTERQIRDVLTKEAQQAIRASVTTRCRTAAESEDLSRRLLNKVSVARPGLEKTQQATTDGQRFAAALDLLLSLSDETTAAVLVDALTVAAAELGIQSDPAA